MQVHCQFGQRTKRPSGCTRRHDFTVPLDGYEALVRSQGFDQAAPERTPDPLGTTTTAIAAAKCCSRARPLASRGRPPAAPQATLAGGPGRAQRSEHDPVLPSRLDWGAPQLSTEQSSHLVHGFECWTVRASLAFFGSGGSCTSPGPRSGTSQISVTAEAALGQREGAADCGARHRNCIV